MIFQMATGRKWLRVFACDVCILFTHACMGVVCALEEAIVIY